MRRKKGVSFGTLVMVCLSVLVLVGAITVLERMGGGKLEHFDASELISAMHGSLAPTDAPSATPAPQSTIKTTVVTLAPTQTKAPQIATQEPVSHTITLTAGGQLAFQSDVSDSAYNKETGQFDYAPIVQGIADQIYADLNICTLPHLIGADGAQYADISTVPQVLEAVKWMGMDKVLLNHGSVLDKGEDGLDMTLSALVKNDLGYSGVRDTDVDGKLHFYTVNGVQIALLGYVDTVTSKTGEAMHNSQSVVRMDIQRVVNDISRARELGADVVILSLWWGKNNAANVTDDQRDMAMALCRAGADVILGAGTDALLPVEWVEAVDATGHVRRSLCAYSLGTLLGEKRDSRSQVCSALLHLRLTINSADGSVSFDQIAYTPTYIWKQEIDGKVQFRVIQSSLTPPAEMSQRQQEIMGRALALVQQVMGSGPAAMREQ